MSLSNLSTDPIETLTAWFNPTMLATSVAVEWVKHSIPGLAYRPKHYIGTDNTTVPLELFHRTREPGDKTRLQEYERWYQSLAYPLADGSLPIVLWRWPRVAALPCTINSVKTDYREFARDGAPKVLTVSLELESYTNGDAPTHESVKAFGLVRAGSPGVRSGFLNGVPR
jgi:hypothetical protein